MKSKNKIILIILAAILLIVAGLLIWLIKTGRLGSSADLLRTKDKVTAYTKFSEYYLYEPVTFGLRNDGSAPVKLTDSAWKIQNVSTTIFAPYDLQKIIIINPGESKEWSWNQKDKTGTQVKPGNYKVIFEKFKVSADFSINLTIGSEGYFTFSFKNASGVILETLTIYLTNPQSIRDAIDHFYKKNIKGIPNGLLVDDRPGRSPYDSQWSWHMDPQNTVMSEFTIEICDGNPSMVEKNLDYWLKNVKRFCPWSADLTSLTRSK